MKIQKYQLIERCTQDDYSSGRVRPILQQVYFDGETLRACDGVKAVVVHPTDIDENDKPGYISMSASKLDAEGKWEAPHKFVNPLIEARKAEKGSDAITITVDDQGVSTQAGRFHSDAFDKSTKYPDFASNTPKDPGYLFTLDVAHLLDLADTLLDMQGKKGGRRHTGEGLELYWSQTHPDSITVKPMLDNKEDYGVLMLMDRSSRGHREGPENMSGVLSPRASGVDNADSDLPSREEYRLVVKQYTDVLLERNELRDRVAELEAQRRSNED